LITSRPQTTSLLSFILFLAIAYTVIFLNVLAILSDPRPQWLNYVIVTALTPMALFITYKVVFRYKIISMGNDEIKLRYPLFRLNRSYKLKEVAHWKESFVKTGKRATYKELEILFSDKRKITMAFKEYTEYEKMVAYLERKIPKLKS
jgi:hypothetical protein